MLLTGGRYFDWGMNREGQLGDGTTGHAAAAPVRVQLPGPVSSVAEGGSLPGNGQTLAQLDSGALYAWGADSSGQLGNGKRAVAEPAPVRFAPPTGVTYRVLATSGSTSYAVSTTGNVYAWGAGDEGQVGDGNRQTALTPVLVASAVANVSATADDVAVSVR